MPEVAIQAPVGLALQEQFANAGQQREAAKLGIWIWLATELLLFAGLFATAFALHLQHPASVTAAARHLKLWIGSVNTAVLICSSLTMSGAIASSRLGLQRLMVQCMLATAALGSLFLVLKGYEYARDYAEHLTPFLRRAYAIGQDPASQLFVDLYFVTTALHGLHLTTGVSLLLWVTMRSSRPDFLRRHQNWIEVFGLYWHFIDLIWIMVFLTLYVLSR